MQLGWGAVINPVSAAGVCVHAAVILWLLWRARKRCRASLVSRLLLVLHLRPAPAHRTAYLELNPSQASLIPHLCLHQIPEPP